MRDESVPSASLFEWRAFSKRFTFPSVRPVILAGRGVIVLITLLTITTAVCATSEQPSPAYWLFSWSSRSGARHYALVPQAEKHAFMVTFNRSLPGMLTLAALETRLRTLPKGVLVGFGEATCVGITYPHDDLVSRIKRFAAANNLRLVLIQGVCE